VKPGFPQGAHAALRNPQLRRNLALATTTIRGKPYENTYCFVFRFNDDGQIQYLTEHWNTWHAYRQLFNNFDVEPAHPLG